MDTIEIGHNSAIVAYSEFRGQIAELRELNSKVAFDYEDTRGNKDARTHVYKLRQTKSAVEKARKDEKAASLEYGRRVDEQAKAIMTEIEAMIDVHAKPLEEIEQREKNRVAKHQDNMREISEGGNTATERWSEWPLEMMTERLAEIEAEPITEEYWEEFALQAAQAREVAITQIKAAISRWEKRDAEQAELARLRQEAEDRSRADREADIRREAEQKAAREAEIKAEQERLRVAEEAERAKQESERRELELRLTAERAEREKSEAEQRATNAAKEAEERLRCEAEEKARKEAAEAEAREANKRHRTAVNRKAKEALVAGGLSEIDAVTAITLIAQKAVPHVHISY